MDNQKRKKIIWGLVILLVIIGLVFLIWSLLQQQITTPPEEEEYVPPQIEMESADLEYQPLAPGVGQAEFEAVTLAKTYAERFGSWSTDAGGHNLTELIPKSTPRMKTYLNSIEADSAAEYLGISTRALATETLSIDSAQATIKVSAQRTETKADLTTNVYYQDIEISLVKLGDDWLVDAAYWQ